MPLQMKRKTRELGTALAVLAIYVLTLLAPLHQAAGLQRDLGKLGYETIGVWSICTSLAQQNDESGSTGVKCAASGIGKNDIAAVAPASIDIEMVRVGADIAFTPLSASRPLALPLHVGQPRAPPVLV